MKKILFLSSLLVSLPMIAEENICEEYGSTAELIMQKRQSGVDISQMLKIANSLNKKSKDVFTNMIIDAYDRPEYSGSKYKNEEIKKFKERYYIACLKKHN